MSPRVKMVWEEGRYGKDIETRTNSHNKARKLFVPKSEGGHGYEWKELEPGLFLVQSPDQLRHDDWGYYVWWPQQTCSCPVQKEQGWAGCKHSLGLYFEFADKGGKYGAEEEGDNLPTENDTFFPPRY